MIHGLLRCGHDDASPHDQSRKSLQRLSYGGVDDPYTTAFAPCSDSPATFPDPAFPHHDDAIFRMARNERNALLSLCLSHPCGSPLLKLTGFDHGHKACIAALAL